MTKADITKVAGWNFDNSYTGLPKSFYSNQKPETVPSPKLVVLNNPLAQALGLNPQILEKEGGVNIFAGIEIPEGSLPIAQAYAGHQFGHFTMLGDGRAVLLGEQVAPSGQRFDIQLKGSGRTPYSRRGDGRAALGPMLREYIISEAMHALGIPTTRSLAVVTTGKAVIRETSQPGAVLTRVAASHIRVGTFEYASKLGTMDDLRALADYTLKRHYPEGKSAENPYLFLLHEVIKNQAALIAKWMLVGFIHGVMNTDNMTISGETIDYGPCAFMDIYNPETVFSSIDTHGRYAYGNQPSIGAWNLARFAETLLPLIHANQDEAIKLAQDAISHFTELYHQNLFKGMRSKLGIFNEEQGDESLIKDLLDIMHKYKADYTNTFRALTLNKLEGGTIFGSQEFKQWYGGWKVRLGKQQQSIESAYQLMKNSNPGVIPRNHRVEAALEAAVNKGDYGVMKRLVAVLADPYSYSSEQEEYTTPPEPSNCSYRTYCGT